MISIHPYSPQNDNNDKRITDIRDLSLFPYCWLHPQYWMRTVAAHIPQNRLIIPQFCLFLHSQNIGVPYSILLLSLGPRYTINLIGNFESI